MLILAAASLFPGGCGGEDLSGQLLNLLRERSGTVSSIRFTCITEDGANTYREEVEFLLPDHLRYRMYDLGQDPPRLLTVIAQEENGLYRFRSSGGVSREGKPVEELFRDIPPLRNRGSYLSLYHLLGNGDYYSSLTALIHSGVLLVTARDEISGKSCYHLCSAPAQEPAMEIWVDTEYGLPLRKEMTLEGGRKLIFSYQDLEIDSLQALEPFPAGVESGAEGAGLEAKDGGCRPLSLEEAGAVLGFAPLVPEIPGFELYRAWWRDPAASGDPSERSLRFPEGFRELYLVYRSGNRQLEIRESPFLKDFGYYTTGLATLSEVYLAHRETLGEEEGNALYAASLDCQEMHLLAGEVEVTVTGDAWREEMRDLARRLHSMAGSR